MTHYDALQVHLELDGATVFAGSAQFHRGRGSISATTFQYDPGYLSHPHAYPIDPALELVSGSLHTTGLPGAFADSAPDRWGRNLITKRERALARQNSRRRQELDDVDFLTAVSDATREGALRFRAASSEAFLDPGHSIPQLIRLPELLHAADIAARDTAGDDYEAIKELLGAGTASLGGARPKSAVLGDGGRQLIAKFPHHDDGWDVMAWEATALDLATAAGVLTPTHRLVRIEGRGVLLLDRFDRSTGSSARRIGYMSAMTLLEHRDGESADYVDIAERLEEVSATTTADARELFLRVAVSVGLNNTDDHLRNHGFLRGRAGWTLSPAFDVNPNPSADARQTTIAGADTASDQADGLLELAHVCRLSPDEATGAITRVADTVATWREAATRNGVGPHELPLFEAALEAGIGTLRQAAASGTAPATTIA